MRELTKLTDKETSKPLYVDLQKVVGIGFEFPDMDYNNSPATPKGTLTKLILESGCELLVEEHGSVVLALLEGRDPSPSKILFGKKKNDGNQT